MLASYGVEIAGKLFDTMIAHYLLEPDMRHNMNALSENYLGYSPIKIETLIGEKGKSQGTMRDVPLDKIAEYAAEDADITWQLAQIFRTRLEKENLLALFNQIEMPLIPVLAKMERTGVCINTPALADYAVELQHDIQTLEAELIEMAGEPFNPASPKQLGEILFDKLKLDPMAKKTEKSNQYATNEKVLQKLSTKHPIINKILDYRELRKLLSTYVEALPLLVNERTGRVHTSYNQAVAATGRLSSTDPNLQNIPVRTTKGRELRKAFIPSDAAHQLLSADYSQIELRIIAHLSGDSNMVEAFRNGYDIHAATAAKIYNIPIEEVSREMRSNAKGANFGIVYGISSFGLAENLGISRTEAKMLIDGYFANYPGVKVYMDKCVATAREHGYVSTLMGRKRYLPDINSANGMGRGMAERNAINAPIQGSAADIIKLAMIRIDAEFTAQNIQSTMTMQVHDELVFDVLETEIDTVKEIVIRQMEAAVALSVPLTAEAGIGHNWLEAH
jgi:DNA polymerase-1